MSNAKINGDLAVGVPISNKEATRLSLKDITDISVTVSKGKTADSRKWILSFTYKDYPQACKLLGLTSSKNVENGRIVAINALLGKMLAESNGVIANDFYERFEAAKQQLLVMLLTDTEGKAIQEAEATKAEATK